MASTRYKATLTLAERFRRAAATEVRSEEDWLDKLFHGPSNDDNHRPGDSRPHVREVG